LWPEEEESSRPAFTYVGFFMRDIENSPTPTFELKSVSAGYRAGETVVDQVDLRIEEGSFTGLIGPNGCGKTTLLRAMSGIIKPTAGTIFLRGQKLDQLSRREIACYCAVVPQETPMAFAFTVREIVAMGRHPYVDRFRSMTDDDELVIDEVMSRTMTMHLAHRNVLELSGGERQRVIVARALCQRPQVLLLDEPTAHLDINHQIELLELLHELCQEQGLTIVCATHDLNHASAYCDRILLLLDGRPHAFGTPAQVISHDIIRDTYGVDVHIEYDGERPFVVPVSARRRNESMAASVVVGVDE